MAKAIWQGQVIADSPDVEIVEGNLYFPPAAIDRRFLQDSAETTVCGWKGTARYYDIVVDGKTNAAAAWYYPDPKPAAAQIRGYIAFWHGVTIEP